MFKLTTINKYLKEKEKEFMSHISKDILNLVIKREKISLELYEKLLMNSYEAKLIEPLLTDEAFIWKLENAIKNVSIKNHDSKFYLPIVYEDYLATDGVNELLKRFKEKINV